MEKLENKILEKINNDIVLSKQDYPWRYAPEWASKQIAQEVKDIAIAFVEWKENLSESDLEKWNESESGSFTVGRKSNEDLFNDFIQTY